MTATPLMVAKGLVRLMYRMAVDTGHVTRPLLAVILLTAACAEVSGTDFPRNYAHGIYRSAVARMAFGQPESVVDPLFYLAEADPDFPDTQNALAVAIYFTQAVRRERALRYSRRAVALDGNNDIFQVVRILTDPKLTYMRPRDGSVFLSEEAVTKLRGSKQRLMTGNANRRLLAEILGTIKREGDNRDYPYYFAGFERLLSKPRLLITSPPQQRFDKVEDKIRQRISTISAEVDDAKRQSAHAASWLKKLKERWQSASSTERQEIQQETRKQQEELDRWLRVAEEKMAELNAEISRFEAFIRLDYTALAQLRVDPQPTDTVQIRRYPTIQSAASVKPEQQFSVLVSLTIDKIIPDVVSTPGPGATTTESGQLEFPLHAMRDEWDLTVVLSAPGFNVIGKDWQQIRLAKRRDSTPALFHLKAHPIENFEQTRSLTATLWYQGTYLASFTRQIVVARDIGSVRTIDSSPRRDNQMGTSRSIELELDREPPDLTVLVQSDLSSDHVSVVVMSPFLKPTGSEKVPIPKELSAWLKQNYARFATVGRGVAAVEEYLESERESSRSSRAAGLLKGFGLELYQRFAPTAFKTAFWKLVEEKGSEFDSIQILTDRPILPWELMRPLKGDRTVDFLGIEYRLARWHLAPATSPQTPRPPQSLLFERLVTIAPEYKGSLVLPLLEEEIRELQNIAGFQRLPGKFDTFSNLFANLPENSIIHFAGHGSVQEHDGFNEYAINLSDGKLDLTMWRGLMVPRSGRHPLIFLNACDVGQAHKFANFVEGWAPAMLEAGASGYISGLWPLADRGAAEFAIRFYRQLELALEQGPVIVADVLKSTRQHFYNSGDPTFLAYVYYGDPNFKLSQ